MSSYASKCYTYYGPGKVQLETRNISCGPTDLILKIEVCGRCGTDRRLFEKSHLRVRTPTVLGHELVGRVVEVGSGMHKLSLKGFTSPHHYAFDDDPEEFFRTKADGRKPLPRLSEYVPRLVHAFDGNLDHYGTIFGKGRTEGFSQLTVV